MECFVALVILVIVLIVMSSSASGRGGSHGSYSFRHLATRYGGNFQPGGWFSFPSVRFRHGEAHALLHVVKFRGSSRQGSGRGTFTQLVVDWPDSGTWIQVYPVALSGWLQPVSGLERCATGDLNFDREFVVFCNDAHAAKKLLSEGVRLQIYRLRHLLGNQHVEVMFYNGRLHVRKMTAIREYEVLEHFTRTALTLFDQAMLTQCEGIEFVGEKTAAPVESIVCKICGEDVVTDMVFCKRCKTPHHGECWQYNGGCSVFACQETECAAPRIAQLSPDP